MFSRTLGIREKVLEADHPRLLESLRDLADVYAASGDAARSIPLYERALPISVTVLGSEHGDARELAAKLATLYRSVGREDDAESLSGEYPR